MTSNRPPATTPTGTKESSPPDQLDLASTASPLIAPGKTARARSTTTIARATRTGRAPRNPAVKASHIKQTGVSTLPTIRLPLPIAAAIADRPSSARRTAGSRIVNHAGTKERARPTRVSVVMARDRTGSEPASRAMKTSESSAQATVGGTTVPDHMLRAALMREMPRRAARVEPRVRGAHRDTTAAASRKGATAEEKTSEKREIHAIPAFKAGQSALLAASRTQMHPAPRRNFFKATTNTLIQSSSLM
jgi:hypothetical protein